MPVSKLVVLGLVYVALCAGYIAVTPYRTSGHLLTRMQDVPQKDIGAPDERQHTNYIRYLASERAFPVFKPGSADLYETYQSHQPPLYYLLAAPFQAASGENEAAEKWLLRSINIIIGLATVMGIYRTLLMFTGNEPASFFAAAFCSQLPMFIAISSAVTNDMLLYFMAVATLYVLARAWRIGWTWKLAAAAGAVLGLALLTKTTALVLFPVVLLCQSLWKGKGASIAKIFATFGIALLIASPWLIRNQNLYGDPLAMAAFRQASVGNLEASQAIARVGVVGYWGAVWQYALYSFWGVFGYFDIFLPERLYLLLSLFLAASLAGYFVRLMKVRDSDERSLHLVSLVLFAMVLLAFIAYNASYFQAQARYLYPAVLPICSAIAFGVWQLCRSDERRFRVVSTAVLGILFCVNLYVVLWLLPIDFSAITGS